MLTGVCTQVLAVHFLGTKQQLSCHILSTLITCGFPGQEKSNNWKCDCMFQIDACCPGGFF